MEAYRILFTLLFLTLLPTSVAGMEAYETTDGHTFMSDTGGDFRVEDGHGGGQAMGFYSEDPSTYLIYADGNFGEVPSAIKCWAKSSRSLEFGVRFINEVSEEYEAWQLISEGEIGEWTQIELFFDPTGFPWEWVRVEFEGNVQGGTEALAVILDAAMIDIGEGYVLWDEFDYGGLHVESKSFGGIKAAFR
ncbi:hypothetical protein ACFL24_02375 [Patescibacteria group bacterium]